MPTICFPMLYGSFYFFLLKQRMSRLSLVCLFVEGKWVTHEYIPSVIWCRNLRLHETMKGPSYFVPSHFRLHEEGLSQRHNEGGGLGLASVSGKSPVMAHPRATSWLSFWIEFECNWKKWRQRHRLTMENEGWEVHGTGSEMASAPLMPLVWFFSGRRTAGHQAQQLKLNLGETGLT